MHFALSKRPVPIVAFLKISDCAASPNGYLCAERHHTRTQETHFRFRSNADLGVCAARSAGSHKEQFRRHLARAFSTEQLPEFANFSFENRAS